MATVISKKAGSEKAREQVRKVAEKAETPDLRYLAGRLKLTEDPQAFQKRLRDEWK